MRELQLGADDASVVGAKFSGASSSGTAIAVSNINNMLIK